MAQLAHSLAKKALGAPEARDKWDKCVDEMTVMIRVEVETNPRYNSMRKL